MKSKILMFIFLLCSVGIIIENGVKALLVVIAVILFSGFCITFPLLLIMFVIDCVLEGFKEAWKECNPIAIYKAVRSI